MPVQSLFVFELQFITYTYTPIVHTALRSNTTY